MGKINKKFNQKLESNDLSSLNLTDWKDLLASNAQASSVEDTIKNIMNKVNTKCSIESYTLFFC
jgi:hypothetical protein